MLTAQFKTGHVSQHIFMQDIPTRVTRRLRQRREALGWTMTKVATLAGMSQGFYSRLERGEVGFGPETISKLAGTLGITIDRLYAPDSNVEFALMDFRKVPVIDYAEASTWASVYDRNSSEMRETISTNLDVPASTFAIRINGNSMEPRFNIGDVVIINPSIQPRPGDFVVASDDQGQSTFRQYRAAGINERGEDIFELVPLNAIYGPMRSDRQKISIVGVLIEHRIYRTN